MPVAVDNKVLGGKTQRLCPSQTLETLAISLGILIYPRKARKIRNYIRVF